MKRGSFLFSSALILSLGLIACGGEPLPGEEGAREAMSDGYAVNLSLRGTATSASSTTLRASFAFLQRPSLALGTGAASSVTFAVRHQGGSGNLAVSDNLYAYLPSSSNCTVQHTCGAYLDFKPYLGSGTHNLELVRTSAPTVVLDTLTVVVDTSSPRCGSFTARAWRALEAQSEGNPIAVKMLLGQMGYGGAVTQKLSTTGYGLPSAIESSVTCQGDGTVSCTLNHLLQFNSTAYGSIYRTEIFCEGTMMGTIYFKPVSASQIDFWSSPGLTLN